MQDPKNFQIADSTASCRMTLYKETLDFAKYFVVNNFVRVVNVDYDSTINTIKVGPKSVVFMGNPIAQVVMPLDLEPQQGFANLSSTHDLDPHTSTKGTILAKVVQIQNKRMKTIYGKKDLRKIILKDKLGNKTKLTIWGNKKFQNIEEGNVYLFSRLATEKFPKLKPHYLTARDSSTITLAPQDLQEEMRSISLEDGLEHGIVIGIKDIHKYESCNNCHSKVNDTKYCDRCDYENDTPDNDFRFTLVLDADDDLKIFVGFKRGVSSLIGNDPNLDIEKELNSSLCQKSVRVSFMNQFIIKTELQDEEEKEIYPIILSITE